MLTMFLLYVLISVEASVLTIKPSVDSCSVADVENAITHLELSASCAFAYNYASLEDGCTAQNLNSTVFNIKIDADGNLFESTVDFSDVGTDGGDLPTEYDDLSFSFSGHGYKTVTIFVNDEEMGKSEMRVIPGWVSLLPIFVLFGVALASQQVLIALPAGVWMALWIVEKDLNPVMAFWNTWDTFVTNFSDNASILVFTLTIAGAIAIVNKSGGSQGLANLLIPYIKDSTTASLVGFGEGLMIFFDDYADTLICGTTLRKFTDHNRISREKFAFLVDATAAPIASVAPISSWIGFELSLIEANYIANNDFGDHDAYSVFMETLPYRFYPWLMLIFMLTNILSERDFGPMVLAERRARKTGKVVRDGASVDESALQGDPHMDPKPEVVERNAFYWYLGAIPIAILIFGTLIIILVTGSWTCEDEGLEKSAKNLFGNGDSYSGLLWSSVLAAIVGACLSRVKNTLYFAESLDAWIYGMKGMMEPILILVWAWSFGSVIKKINTSDFIVDSLGDSLTDTTLPFVSFLISGLCSLMMGSSWATMSLMFPLVMPLATEVADGDRDVILHCIGTILAGSVFGDHCSPISDTTVLSSIACGCDHQDHVTTQLPYALAIGFIGSIFGDLITRAGCPWYVSYMISITLVVGMVFGFGTKIPKYTPETDELTGADLESLSPFESLIGRAIWSKTVDEKSDMELEKRAPEQDGGHGETDGTDQQI